MKHPSLVSDWLTGSVAEKRRRRDKFWSFYYYKLPYFFKPVNFLQNVFKLLQIASGPLIAAYFYKTLGVPQALYASVVLVSLYLALSVLKWWKERRSNGSGVGDRIVFLRISELVQSVQSAATLSRNKPDSIRSCLGIIEACARNIAKSKEGDVSVSLVMYKGSSTNKMEIRYRNHGSSRKTPHTINDLSVVLGHYLCQSEKRVRIVNDLKAFGADFFVSPSGSEAKYRSVCFFRIDDMQTDRPRGFVSVDCTTPYAFAGRRGKNLIIDCEAMIDHIQHIA